MTRAFKLKHLTGEIMNSFNLTPTQLKTILTTVFLFTFNSMAHLKPGTLKGTQPNGQACELKISSVYFLNNFNHPLNERADIEVLGNKFTIQHPPVISSEAKVAYFNHDLFQGINPNTQGALAIEIKMQHTSRANVYREEGGPKEFHLIQHIYKGDKRSLLSCLNLMTR